MKRRLQGKSKTRRISDKIMRFNNESNESSRSKKNLQYNLNIKNFNKKQMKIENKRNQENQIRIDYNLNFKNQSFGKLCFFMLLITFFNN
jgi:acyl-CoA thioesterase